MKFFSEHTKSQNYAIALNKIFYTQKFRDYYTSLFGMCPSGLTMDAEFKNNELNNFYVSIKQYGCESKSNNGTAFTDLSDYEVNDDALNKLTDKHTRACVEYIKNVDPELYDTVTQYIKYTE